MVSHSAVPIRSTSWAEPGVLREISTIKSYVAPSAHSVSRFATPGVRPGGDDFYTPLLLSGTDGTFTVDLTDFTVQTGEPSVAGETVSLWLRRWPPGPGRLRIWPTTSDGTIAVDAWEGERVEDLERKERLDGNWEGIAAFTTNVPDIEMSSTTRVRFRTTGPTTAVADAAWQWLPPGTWGLDLDVLTVPDPTTGIHVDQAPGVVLVSLVGAQPGETVRLQVTGSTYYQDFVADETGVFPVLAAQVIRGTPPGAKALVAVGLTSGLSGVAKFRLGRDTGLPTPPPADAAPVAVTQSGVRRWVFQDPMTGGLGQWIMPRNPDYASDPFPPKYLTPEHTAAFDGQWIMWQGAERATEWRFAGTSDTEAHHDALVQWAGCRTRIHIHDHRNRAFLARIKKVSLTPAARYGLPWRHEYEVTADVYGWVQL